MIPSLTYYFPSTPKEFFKYIYFAGYDQTISGLREGFDQPDYQIVKANHREDFTEELERLINIYDGDFEKFNLKSQLKTATKDSQ